MKYSRRLVARGALLLACLLGITWGMNVSAATSCQPYYIPSRLLPGSEGRVVMEGGANNVRDAAASSGNRIGQLPPGSTFTVVDGPVCSEGHTWVRVDNHAGLVGWTVEIIEGRYGLEPNVTVLPPAVFGPGPVDYAGIHFELDPNLATQVEAKFLISEQFKAQTMPPHIEFSFTPTNPGELPFYTLRVMSAQSFNNLYLTTISQLASFLTNPDPTGRGIPQDMAAFVTDWSSIAQRTQVIPFGSGQVFRGFSTTWHDATNPSDWLNYAAHGLSSDGIYYVQANFVTYYYDLSIYEPPPGDPADDAYIDNFHANIRYTIDAARDEDFTPRPSQVDALFASLTIAPGTLEEVMAQANVVAASVAPTQEAMFLKLTSEANAWATTSFGRTATQSALSPALTATADARCGTLNTRLQVGQNARQTLSGNNSLRVRDTAGGQVIPETFLYPGDVVRVLEGPVCVDEVNWWRVRSSSEGWTGWIAESMEDNYYMGLIPPTATPYPTRMPNTAIPDYDCTYRPSVSNERAALVPRAGGEWQYYLYYEEYEAVGQYTNENGETWYLFSPQSRLYGFADGGGTGHLRSFWGTSASGSGCSRLPDVPPSFIERTFD